MLVTKAKLFFNEYSFKEGIRACLTTCLCILSAEESSVFWPVIFRTKQWDALSWFRRASVFGSSIFLEVVPSASLSEQRLACCPWWDCDIDNMSESFPSFVQQDGKWQLWRKTPTYRFTRYTESVLILPWTGSTYSPDKLRVYLIFLGLRVSLGDLGDFLFLLFFLKRLCGFFFF